MKEVLSSQRFNVNTGITSDHFQLFSSSKHKHIVTRNLTELEYDWVCLAFSEKITVLLYMKQLFSDLL